MNIDTFSLNDKWKPIVEWARAKPTMIILDEATCIKNVESNRTQRLLTCFNDIVKSGRAVRSSTKLDNCKVRCVLTGTPVTNGPMDLWSIMEFVKPSFFGVNWFGFKQYYGMFTKMSVSGAAGFRQISVLLNENTWRSIKLCRDYQMAYQVFGVSQDTYFTIQSQDTYQGPYKNAQELRQKLQSTAMFKKIKDCIDMPDQVFIERTMHLNKEQAEAYKDLQSQMITQYEGVTVTALNKLTMATKLQQVSSGFLYNSNVELDEDSDLTPDQVVWLGKSNPKLDMLLDDVAENDRPLIILTRYSAEAAKIYDLLKDNYNVLLYTGWKKTGTLDDFKEGNYDILVANIRCIAFGFNLQISHTTLYYSNTFSMELREQSQSRTFRAGQKEVCKYIDYTNLGTIDEKIIKALRHKKSMLEYFRTEDDTLLV